MKYLHGVVIEDDEPKNYKILYENKNEKVQLRHHPDTGQIVIKIGQKVETISKEFSDELKKHCGLVQAVTEKVLH